MLRPKIAIDLGTCNCIILRPDKGIVLIEPSVVAISEREQKVLAVGKEAKKMLGKTPKEIKVYRPLKEGVIASYRITSAMIYYFVERARKRFEILKPELVISIPAGASSNERRAVIEAGLSAGARECFVVKEPLLAALGAGIPIEEASGSLILNIGGGTTESAVISLGGIVTFSSLRIGGDKMDEKISEYIKNKFNLAIGFQTAERIKIKIGTAFANPEKKRNTFEVKGRDLITGLPKIVKVSSADIAQALAEVLEEIVEGVRKVLRSTPAELSADIMEKGMVLTGGGALLQEIDRFISQKTNVPAFLSEDPLLAVAKGAGIILKHLDEYKQIIPR